MSLIKTVAVTKVVAAADNYSAEDVISESATTGTAWIFRGMGGSGYIVKVQVIVQTTAQAHRLVLYLFDTLPTSELSDRVANTALLHVDLANYIGPIELSALRDYGGDSETIAVPSTVGNVPLAFATKTPEDAIWGILVTPDAFTGENVGDEYTVILTVDS